MKVEEYNEYLRKEYEKTKSVELLEKYIISETLSPLEDYQNVIRIIRSNYPININVHLLYIGAYCISGWLIEERNEMLDILNDMYLHLSNRDKSIVCFLNAYQLRFADKKYSHNPKYKEWLLDSIRLNDAVVKSRIYLAALYPQPMASEIYAEALARVQKVYEEKEIIEMGVEDFSNIDAFINEHILGTHISTLTLNMITNRIREYTEPTSLC